MCKRMNIRTVISLWLGWPNERIFFAPHAIIEGRKNARKRHSIMTVGNSIGVGNVLFDCNVMCYYGATNRILLLQWRCVSQTEPAYSLGRSQSPRPRTLTCSQTAIRSPGLPF